MVERKTTSEDLMGKSYRGMGKAGALIDRLNSDMERRKGAYEPTGNVAPEEGWKPAWTPERWGHRIKAQPAKDENDK